MRQFKILLLGLVLTLVATTVPAFCQQPQPLNSTVQLPTVRFFDIRTAVQVPDVGTMSLGGVSRSGSFSNSSGAPFLGPLRNRSTAGFASASGAGVSVTILSNREMDDAVTAEGLRRQAWRQQTDPNGSTVIQRQADFITRNIGRR